METITVRVKQAIALGIACILLRDGQAAAQYVSRPIPAPAPQATAQAPPSETPAATLPTLTGEWDGNYGDGQGGSIIERVRIEQTGIDVVATKIPLPDLATRNYPANRIPDLPNRNNYPGVGIGEVTFKGTYQSSMFDAQIQVSGSLSGPRWLPTTITVVSADEIHVGDSQVFHRVALAQAAPVVPAPVTLGGTRCWQFVVQKPEWTQGVATPHYVEVRLDVHIATVPAPEPIGSLGSPNARAYNLANLPGNTVSMTVRGRTRVLSEGASFFKVMIMKAAPTISAMQIELHNFNREHRGGAQVNLVGPPSMFEPLCFPLTLPALGSYNALPMPRMAASFVERPPNTMFSVPETRITALSSGGNCPSAPASCAVSRTIAPPQLLTLANLSSNVYSGNDGYGEYNFIANNCTAPPNTCMNAGLAAGAYGNADNSEIVIAIRGTVLEFAPFSDQQGVSADAISTLGADLSFGGRIPNKKFKSNLRDAAAFLKYVQTQFPQANITLTGHSLGGAIAQILGQATNLSTYAFNSPGAENLYDALRPDLRDLLQCQNPSYISINYRILGDQVSKFGRPVGRTLTIKNPPSFQWTADPIYDAYQNFMALATIFFRLHSITTVISQIADNAPIVPAVGEPDYTLIIENNVHHN